MLKRKIYDAERKRVDSERASSAIAGGRGDRSERNPHLQLSTMARSQITA